MRCLITVVRVRTATLAPVHFPQLVRPDYQLLNWGRPTPYMDRPPPAGCWSLVPPLDGEKVQS
jgi:hypothetical protein